MKLLGPLDLRGISGQIAALVVASIVAIHLIITTAFLLHRPDQIDPSVDRGHSQLAAAVVLLGTTPAAERPRLFADLARAFPQLAIASLPDKPAGAAAESDRADLRSLRRHLSSNYRIFPLSDDTNIHKVGIVLPDGAVISAKLSRVQRQRPFWGSPWMITLLFGVICVSLLGLWAARALTA
ncbi:MAG: ATP-binding protein, partial [Bradyrhizobium sp.]